MPALARDTAACFHGLNRIIGNGIVNLSLAAALVHGSKLRTEPPSPERDSHHFVAVRHPE